MHYTLCSMMIRTCYHVYLCDDQVLIKNAEILENFEPTLENSTIVETAKTAVELTPEVAEAISDLWTCLLYTSDAADE